MAGSDRPDETAKSAPGASSGPEGDDLARRTRALEAALAARKPARRDDEDKSATGSMAGFGQAMKLSSEFIAGIVVGAGLGWLIDRMAGTSPWGLIIFLFLGFGAGVLNVLRAAGVVAEPGSRDAGDDASKPERK